MSRAVACLLLTAVLHAACVAATTYGVYSYYAGTGCEGTPYAVYAYEDAECLDTECAAYDGSASGTTIEKMTVDCTTDYVSATRDKFSSTKYIIEVGFNEESCSTLYYAYGVPALGNCEGSFKENDSFYIIGSLNSNGSAAIKYYNDSQCATTETGVDSASKETLATHSCDANWVKWYTSNDDDASSSGSATQEDSSGLSTGAIIGIICGCVVVLLLVIGGALLYRRRRRAQGKTGGQWTATLPSGDLTALEAAMSGQSGLWNDDVITAKRIPRDKVKIKKLLSRGAYGEVYTGVFNGQQVAVKMLLPATRGNLQHVTDFLTEAKMTASMDHPHIVTFVGVAWDSLSDLCVVLEFMDGGDLRSLLNQYEATKHPVGIDREKATIALHVCHALTYLHSLIPPIIHRDLKSRNILLNQAKEAKVTDFGISRERLDQTMTAGVGTSLWMAPEVMLGEQYGVKADIFSFGVVLSELDVHTLPYSQAKQRSLDTNGRKMADATLLQKITAGEVHVEFSASNPKALVELGYACVSVDPADRPSSAEALYRLQVILQELA
uniref:Protein kinase domain-containing protein n=1 Tax=Phytophthora ramorum TaxID=164328 RepID=H3GMR2_PHYRM